MSCQAQQLIGSRLKAEGSKRFADLSANLFGGLRLWLVEAYGSESRFPQIKTINKKKLKAEGSR